MKKRQVKRPAASEKPARRSRDRRMVRIEQEPLRREAATDCGRALKTLEKLRGEWRRHEQEDLPAYERWKAATLGPLLTKLREIEARLREKDALVREVEEEVMFGRSRTYRAAYAAVLERRQHPPRTATGREEGGSEAAGSDRKDDAFDEVAQEMLFEDFLRAVMGVNPDRLSDAKYEQMFGEFKDHILGGRARREAREETHGEAREDHPPAAAARVPKPVAGRLKEIYRILVRRLHPDTRAELDPAVAALWHDVQEAYQAGQVERLEMLLALTEMQKQAPGEGTTLFQMRAVLHELRRAVQALKQSLGTARRSAAWDFGRQRDRAALRKKLAGKLEGEIKAREGQLQQVEFLLRQWAIPPAVRPGKKTRPPQGTDRQGTKIPRQQDFSF